MMETPKIKVTIENESGQLLLMVFVPVDMLGRFLTSQGQQLEAIIGLPQKPIEPIPPVD